MTLKNTEEFSCHTDTYFPRTLIHIIRGKVQPQIHKFHKYKWVRADKLLFLYFYFGKCAMNYTLDSQLASLYTQISDIGH